MAVFNASQLLSKTIDLLNVNGNVNAEAWCMPPLQRDMLVAAMEKFAALVAIGSAIVSVKDGPVVPVVALWERLLLRNNGR